MVVHGHDGSTMAHDDGTKAARPACSPVCCPPTAPSTSPSPARDDWDFFLTRGNQRRGSPPRRSSFPQPPSVLYVATYAEGIPTALLLGAVFSVPLTFCAEG